MHEENESKDRIGLRVTAMSAMGKLPDISRFSFEFIQIMFKWVRSINNKLSHFRTKKIHGRHFYSCLSKIRQRKRPGLCFFWNVWWVSFKIESEVIEDRENLLFGCSQAFVLEFMILLLSQCNLTYIVRKN